MATSVAPHSSRQPFAPPARGETHAGHAPVNLSDAERWLSAAGGAALGLFGLARGSLGGLALAAAGGSLLYRGLGGRCPVYRALDVSTAGRRGPATSVPAGHGVKVEQSVAVNRPAGDLFRFWRDVENFGRSMTHLESVKDLGGGRSHWVARGPLGVTAAWDAEIFNERPNELIAWRSLPGGGVETAGSVHFLPAPGGRGTEVRVSLKYNPPAGKLGIAAACLLGESPESQIREDLRHFKQLMETGEIPTSRSRVTSRE
jgi:uncharacterized membrane protein